MDKDNMCRYNHEIIHLVLKLYDIPFWFCSTRRYPTRDWGLSATFYLHMKCRLIILRPLIHHHECRICALKLQSGETFG